MQSAGLALLAVVQSLWQAYISAVLVGLGFGARGPLLVALRGDYFGRTAFATISGTMELLITSGSIVAPLFAGYLYDIRGSYSLAFLSIAGASLLGSLLVVAMRPPRGRKEQAHPRTAGVP
jgi:MFS family permease